MTRKRTILFLGILLALLLVPTVLPYLIGQLLLPFWAYLLYAFFLLVNAGIYLANRLFLIDRFFVKGRLGAFSAWNLALLLAGVVLEILVLDLSGRATVGEGVTVSSVLDAGTVVSQRVFVPTWPFRLSMSRPSRSLRCCASRYLNAARRHSSDSATASAVSTMMPPLPPTPFPSRWTS